MATTRSRRESANSKPGKPSRQSAASKPVEPSRQSAASKRVEPSSEPGTSAPARSRRESGTSERILDIAALTVIVREAGGTFTDLCGGPVTLDTTTILATNGALHPIVQRELGFT